MVVKIKYRRGGTIPKLYLVFVLQPDGFFTNIGWETTWIIIR